MRHKALRTRKHPLNLSEALRTFGRLRENPLATAVEAQKLGQRLVREVQYLHKIIVVVRGQLPVDYAGYVDPARIDAALARTAVD